MHDATDLELLRRCIDGDRRGWDTFVGRFTRYVYYLVQLTGRRHSAVIDPDEANDLHNDVFLALLEDDCRRLRAFKGRNGCGVRSWLRIITIRTTIDALRRRRVHLSLDDEPNRRPILVAPEPDPLTRLVEASDAARWQGLMALTSDLSEGDQALLHLLFVEKLSVTATCAALRIKRGALYTRKTRLLKRLTALAEAKGLKDS